MQTIGVLGGMFDPIHTGHIRAALAALDNGADRVLLAPCQTPAHRPSAAASAQQRLDMCRLAAQAHPGLEASDIELREETCYAVDTVRLLKRQYPGARICWIVGADKLATLPHWHKAGELFSLCEFWVCPRPGEDAHGSVPGAQLRVLPLPPMQASSGMVISALHAFSDAETLLPHDVARYIAANGLYQPDYAAFLAARGMSESRLAHTLGVRETAVALASWHGACMQRASVAAMLHDLAKPLPLSEMQKIARKYALTLPDDMLQDANLLHGPVAAAIAQHEMNVQDAEILSAIACHTTGKPGMSTLDQVLFIADAIEPNRRDYPGLSEMRALAAHNLKGAVLLSMQRTREYVLSQGHRFCPLTESAMLDLANKEELS